MRIGELFNIIQGHQITDEEIYNGSGNIPIYTAGNIIKGYGSCSLVTKEMLPCITYQTKGFSGVLTIQNELFNANNTAVLFLKDEYKSKVNLNYVKIILQEKFKEFVTGESGVSYLNKEIVLNIDIDLPIDGDEIDTKEQKNLVEKYNNLFNYYNDVKEIILKIDAYEKNILRFSDDFTVKKVSEIAVLNKGSNQISEESIYKNFDKDGVPVYSSATANKGIMGYVSKEFFDNFHKKGNAGELTWTTNGYYAGTVFYRDSEYLYSEKCGRIVLKEKFSDLINVKYLQIFLNQRAQNYRTAEETNAKLEILHMSEIPVHLPVNELNEIDIDKQNEIVKKYEELDYLRKKLESLLKSINV